MRDLYHRNSGARVECPGLSLLPKLKYEHVHLTAFSKMRVDLAAQVSHTLYCIHEFNVLITTLYNLYVGSE